MDPSTAPATPTHWRQSAPLRWALGTGLVFVAGVVMVLLFLLTVATNNRVFEHQQEDMDVNCGGIADGSTSIDECGAYIFEQMLRIASGERSKSEQHGYGQNEFVPWQIGAVT